MVTNLLSLLLLQPDPAMLRALFERAVDRARQEYGPSSPRTADAERDLGLFLANQGDPSRARQPLAGALAIDERALGTAAAQTLEDAAALAAISPPGAAVPLWQRAAAAPDDALAARALAALGELREGAGDQSAAAALYREALDREQAAAANSARVAVRLNSLALVTGPEEGIPLLERALAIDRRLWGERHPETATTEANLSGLLLAAGRSSSAITLGRAALAGFESTLGPAHPRPAAAASNLADALRARNQFAEAERLYRRALAIDELAYGPSNGETLDDVRNLAGFLRERGRLREAAALDRRLAANGAR